MDESGTYDAEWKGAIWENVRSLQLECARVLHEALFMPVLIYGSEIMICKKKERSTMRAVQMDNLKVCWMLGEWIMYQIHG